MAKIAIKSEIMTPFGGIFPIMEHFTSQLGDVIDGTLGRHCKSHGYQYCKVALWGKGERCPCLWFWHVAGHDCETNRV